MPNPTRPKLSVVTITYKDPAGFARTVDSLRPLVRGAGGPSWEFIVVDSSPAENAATVSRVAAEGWPLVHVETPPRGVYGAQNLGMGHSRGEYLWFLNGGDRLRDLATLTWMTGALDSDPSLDLICGGFDRTRDGVYLYAESPRPSLLSNLVGSNRICHQAMLYRRRVFDALGGYSTEYRNGSDYEHHLRCLIAGRNSRCVPHRLVEFASGGSSSDHRLTFDEFRSIHRSLAGQLPRSVAVGNEVLRNLYYARVSAIQFFAKSSTGPVLRRAWVAWQRLKTDRLRPGAPAASRGDHS